MDRSICYVSAWCWCGFVLLQCYHNNPTSSYLSFSWCCISSQDNALTIRQEVRKYWNFQRSCNHQRKISTWRSHRGTPKTRHSKVVDRWCKIIRNQMCLRDVSLAETRSGGPWTDQPVVVVNIAYNLLSTHLLTYHYRWKFRQIYWIQNIEHYLILKIIHKSKTMTKKEEQLGT